MDTDENVPNIRLPDAIQNLTVLWMVLICGCVVISLVSAFIVTEFGPFMDEPWSDTGLIFGVFGSLWVIGMILSSQFLVPKVMAMQPNPSGKPLALYQKTWFTSIALVEGSAIITAVFFMICANPLLIGAFVIAVVAMVAMKPAEEKYNNWLRHAGRLANSRRE